MTIFNSLGSNYNFDFVLKSLFIKGDNSNFLEKTLTERFKGQVFLVYKGREALELAIKLLELPSGSFVAINGFTCFAVYQAIRNNKLNVAYLDIDRETLNFSAETLKSNVDKNPQIKAVIVQNTLGYPADIEKITKICRQKKIIIIEDLAHSVGTIYPNGKRAGDCSDLVALSFSQDKIIDGISGGALIVKSATNFSPLLVNISAYQQLIDRLYPFFTYLIRNSYSVFFGKLLHFLLKRFHLLSTPMPKIKGFHKLPGWYQKIIDGQLKHLEKNLIHRKKIAAIYAELINPKILSLELVKQINISTNLRFPIFVDNRNKLINFLKKKGIYVSDIWYDAPIAPKRYLVQTDYQNQCPNAQQVANQIVNLPTHQNVSENEAKNIAEAINKWLLQ